MSTDVVLNQNRAQTEDQYESISEGRRAWRRLRRNRSAMFGLLVLFSWCLPQFLPIGSYPTILSSKI